MLLERIVGYFIWISVILSVVVIMVYSTVIESQYRAYAVQTPRDINLAVIDTRLMEVNGKSITVDIVRDKTTGIKYYRYLGYRTSFMTRMWEE